MPVVPLPRRRGAPFPVDHPSNAGGVDTGGPGDNDGGMEARVAKLEAAMEFVQRDIAQLKQDVRELRSDILGIRTTDFRLLFGAIIAVALGLAGLMAKGFGWL